MRILGRPPVYKGTISDLRISAIDGTAFIDNCSAITAYADNAHRVEIHDSAGKRLVGVLKAAGTGETLGGELLEDPLFDNTAKWSEGVNWAVAGGLASATGSGSLTANENRCMTSNDVADVGISGALYKTGFNVNAYTSGSFRIDIGGTFGPEYSSLSTSDYSFYLTQGGTVKRVYLRCNGTVSFNSATVKQVLTPSADGIVIVNAKGGSTENWLTRDTGFAYNEASYRVIVREYA